MLGCFFKSASNSSNPPPTPKYTFLAATNALLWVFKSANIVSLKIGIVSGEYTVSEAKIKSARLVVELFSTISTNLVDHAPEINSNLICSSSSLIKTPG